MDSFYEFLEVVNLENNNNIKQLLTLQIKKKKTKNMYFLQYHQGVNNKVKLKTKNKTDGIALLHTSNLQDGYIKH